MQFCRAGGALFFGLLLVPKRCRPLRPRPRTPKPRGNSRDALGRASVLELWAQPFQGWRIVSCQPRVARSSQPWADMRNPVGIQPSSALQDAGAHNSILRIREVLECGGGGEGGTPLSGPTRIRPQRNRPACVCGGRGDAALRAVGATLSGLVDLSPSTQGRTEQQYRCSACAKGLLRRQPWADIRNPVGIQPSSALQDAGAVSSPRPLQTADLHKRTGVDLRMTPFHKPS